MASNNKILTAVPNAEPTTSPKKAKSPAKKIAPPKMGMAARNSHARKAPENYVPSLKGNKCQCSNPDNKC